MTPISVSAPGKIHLLGEHSVVYGKPAMIAAINKRCFINLIPQKRKQITITSNKYSDQVIVMPAEIIALTNKIHKAWNSYQKTQVLTPLQSLMETSLAYPMVIIGETMKYFHKSTLDGFTLEITSDIPVGSGMGSSAALAVSITGAVSLFLQNELNKKQINAIAYVSEQRKHGNPSGGDNMTSCYGGLLWYRKETSNLLIMQPLPFTLPTTFSKNIFLIETGQPKESTAEMVHKVRTTYNAHRRLFEKIFTDQETQVRNLYEALQNGNEAEVLTTIKKGQRNLEKIGVVSQQVMSCIRAIEKTGGVAKICGGGGIANSTGSLFVYTKDEQQLADVVRYYGYTYSGITLGEEGVRKE